MNKELLEKKLEEINNVIKSKYLTENQTGILSGLSGASLFQFYYSKYLDVNDYADDGMEILTYSINKINEGYNYPTYCTGIAGTGWVVDHLEQEKFVDVDSDELLPELDDYLCSFMISDLGKGNYDFLHGAIGYAFYFLNRYRNTKSCELKEKYKTVLLKFIELLKKLSEDAGSNKLKWISSIDMGNSTRDEVYNLGLAHGMASIVGILTKLNQYDDFRAKTKTMLREVINYIISFKSKDKKAYSLFPNSIPKKGNISNQSRLAWCYGDLGIGVRFWFAAKELNDRDLKTTALEIMRHSAKRTGYKKSMVTDAGVCHGSFGNAQIFHRMFKETEDPVFKKAADYWIQDGISKATFKDGYAGYKQWNATDNGWKPQIILLEGIAGIGLTIIDYLADFDTNWDECLMIS